MLELSFNYNQKENYRELVLPLVQSRLTTTQASLAIQLAQLVKTAKRSAVLEERRRLAGEIHDSLGQSFSGIHMHLAVAAAALENGKAVLSHIKRAMDLAKFGLSEARRSALSLRSNICLPGPKVLVQSWIFNPLQVMGPASSSAYQSVSLAVRDNERVKKGDLLFEIDPNDFQMVVAV